MYTFLQPPRPSTRVGSPGDGADGKMNDHQGKNTLALSPPPVPGIPHPGVGGSKHPFYSPREIREVSVHHRCDCPAGMFQCLSETARAAVCCECGIDQLDKDEVVQFYGLKGQRSKSQ